MLPINKLYIYLNNLTIHYKFLYKPTTEPNIEKRIINSYFVSPEINDAIFSLSYKTSLCIESNFIKYTIQIYHNGSAPWAATRLFQRR